MHKPIRHYCFTFQILLILSCAFSCVEDEKARDFHRNSREGVGIETKGEEIAKFILGNYYIIGRRFDGTSYTGFASIEMSGKNMICHRNIDGNKTDSIMVMEESRVNGSCVVHARYSIGKCAYDGYYIINSDHDNYPRLSGSMYKKFSDDSFAGYDLEVLWGNCEPESTQRTATDKSNEGESHEPDSTKP